MNQELGKRMDRLEAERAHGPVGTLFGKDGGSLRSRSAWWALACSRHGAADDLTRAFARDR